MSYENDLERASKAKLVLDNPEFQRAFDGVTQAIHEAWERAPIRDIEGQKLLKLQLKLLSDVRANLERAIADGSMAAVELDHRSKVTRFFRR